MDAGVGGCSNGSDDCCWGCDDGAGRDGLAVLKDTLSREDLCGSTADTGCLGMVTCGGGGPVDTLLPLPSFRAPSSTPALKMDLARSALLVYCFIEDRRGGAVVLLLSGCMVEVQGGAAPDDVL